MLSCKEIVQMISSDEEMSWPRKAELKMHLMMCKHCSNYASQLKMMTTGFSKLFSKLTKVESNEVSQLEQDVIQKNIKHSDS